MAPAQRLLSRAYRQPAAAFRVVTQDGVRLVGSRLGEGGPALILCHGFLGWHRKRRVGSFAEELARDFTVYAFDFRGHGESGGLCTYGDREVLDVEAVSRLARQETGGPAVTFGMSMGGTAVIRHAALHGNVRAVVAVSAPAAWDGHTSVAMRRILRVSGTRGGRAVARAIGYRLAHRWDAPATPEELAPRVSPAPLIVVHGIDDHVFDVGQALRIYERALEPKRLMLSARFGHAEDGLTPAFARRVRDRILELIGP